MTEMTMTNAPAATEMAALSAVGTAGIVATSPMDKNAASPTSPTTPAAAPAAAPMATTATDSKDAKGGSGDNKGGDNKSGNDKGGGGAPKKKKPIQHLLAGGAAGFVESSVCHPLDTIKTRMQLRRMTTNRKVVDKSMKGVMGKALGSMRDAEGKTESLGRGALHRTTSTSSSTAEPSTGSRRTAMETVRIKPDTSASSASTTTKVPNALHDVGWKQRLPSTASTASTASSSSSSSASSTAAKTVSSTVKEAASAVSTAAKTVGAKAAMSTTTAASARAMTATSSAAAAVEVAAATTTTASTATIATTASSASISTTAAAASSAATAPGSSMANLGSSMPGVVQAPLGPFGTARRIIQREGPLALYKGLTAVYTGIVPKMAIRFVSFEYYRDVLGGWYGRYAAASGDKNDKNGKNDKRVVAAPGTFPPAVTFLAGLLSGLTEAVVIVTPAEVCKIRLQSQYHSLIDPTQKPLQHAKYKNVLQTAMLITKEEGIGALYKGVVPTMLRQGCNQAVNFTAYNYAKKAVLSWKKGRAEEEARRTGVPMVGEVKLDHWQSLVLGGLSGGMGPLVNNPLDVVKTRMQKQVIHPGKEPKYKSLLQSCITIAKEEGTPALWKGITPRLMRIMPGQAITFMTYEAVSARMEMYGWFDYE